MLTPQKVSKANDKLVVWVPGCYRQLFRRCSPYQRGGEAQVWANDQRTDFPETSKKPPAYNEVIKKEVDRLLESGIITRTESSWISPVVIVTKKDGGPRCCVAYRRLNTVMKRDRWPISRVDEIFDDINGNKILTTIDLFRDIGWLRWKRPARKRQLSYVVTEITRLK